MDAATLMLVFSILLPNTGLGKSIITESTNFILRAPDNDTGSWVWKTANSKMSFRHFHHESDATPGKGYWTLEVTHSETIPKPSQKPKETTSKAVNKNTWPSNMMPYIMLVNSPGSRSDTSMPSMTIALDEKLSTDLLDEFREVTEVDNEAENSLESKENTKPQQVAENSFIQDTPASESSTVQEGNENGQQREENWWLPGEDLVDVEEDGYFHVRNVGRFKLYSLRKDWEEARRKCQRDMGDLAVPDTIRKVRVIRKLLHRFPDIPATAVLRNQVYVGIYDPVCTRDWITVRGDSYTANFWAPGEPDNEAPGEDCVTFRTDGKIRDVPCTYKLPFVCEKFAPFSVEEDTDINDNSDYD